MGSNNLNRKSRAPVPPENEGSIARSWSIVLAVALAFLLLGAHYFLHRGGQLAAALALRDDSRRTRSVGLFGPGG